MFLIFWSESISISVKTSSRSRFPPSNYYYVALRPLSKIIYNRCRLRKYIGLQSHRKWSVNLYSSQASSLLKKSPSIYFPFLFELNQRIQNPFRKFGLNINFNLFTDLKFFVVLSTITHNAYFLAVLYAILNRKIVSRSHFVSVSFIFPVAFTIPTTKILSKSSLWISHKNRYQHCYFFVCRLINFSAAHKKRVFDFYFPRWLASHR